MNGRCFLPIPLNSHFSYQNLPYGVFSRPGEAPRVGVAIGDRVLDLAALQAAGLLPQAPAGVFAQPALNAFMALGRPIWRAVRAQLQHLLAAETPTLRNDAALLGRALRPQTDVTMHLPANVGDYTDFYSSREHATNVGKMFRDPENALLPNWLHLPVAYHGRASSLVVSGTPIRRPLGQQRPAEGSSQPRFGPSQQLDFELEMGFFVGPGNTLGEPVPVVAAADHIFGMVLVNDWSARDIQSWEYRPLGPFLAKNLGTTLSPWVVTLEALAPFRVAAPAQAPPPLSYLRRSGDWVFDIQLEVRLQTAALAEPATIVRSNHRYLYWDVCQQLAHHTITGCNLRPGDLLASGTISGPTPGAYGSMLELTERGQRPLTLSDGSRRGFLADGDTVILTGWCQGDGYRVGFGEARGTITPALARPEA